VQATATENGTARYRTVLALLLDISDDILWAWHMTIVRWCWSLLVSRASADSVLRIHRIEMLAFGSDSFVSAVGGFRYCCTTVRL